LGDENLNWMVRNISLTLLKLNVIDTYEGVSKSFRTESIRKYTLTTIITRWEATQRVMAANLSRLTHKIAIQLHLVAESCTICSSRTRRPVRKLLDTPSLVYICKWDFALKAVKELIISISNVRRKFRGTNSQSWPLDHARSLWTEVLSWWVSNRYLRLEFSSMRAANGASPLH
jgi:hypothetical protein